MYLYDDQAREKLANKIIDFLKGKKLLLDVYSREYEQENLSKKAYSYKLDKAEDIEEVRSNLFEKVYKNFQLLNPKYHANLKVDNKGVGNFEIDGEGVYETFKVHQGRVFKVSFLSSGYNGLIEFLKRNINLDKMRYISDALFEIGKHKIKFSKSFSDTKYIEVLDINFYLQKSLKNNVIDFIRQKQSMRLGGDKETKIIQEKNISLHDEDSQELIEKITPMDEKEKNVFDVKDIDRKKYLKKILNYISNEMKPEKRAKMLLLWMEYKEEKKSHKTIPNSTKEIAEIVGENPTTVRTNISKALQEIRNKFPEVVDVLK